MVYLIFLYSLYSLPDADPVNTWDISSFSINKEEKLKNLYIKKICWSITNKDIFFVLDSVGRILIFDLKYSTLV